MQYLKRIMISFSISAIIGLLVNLIIDTIANSAGHEGFISMTPEFRALFPTPAMAAYVNVILYGLIGATFAGMSFFFNLDRLGFLIQNLLYFLCSSVILILITVFLWQLHHYPQALIPTFAGYAGTYILMGLRQYRELKKNVLEINKELEG